MFPHGFFSHSPMPPFGNTVVAKETRDTIPSYASIFGAKTRDKKATKISI
jgi:hypothetical protein